MDRAGVHYCFSVVFGYDVVRRKPLIPVNVYLQGNTRIYGTDRCEIERKLYIMIHSLRDPITRVTIATRAITVQEPGGREGIWYMLD